jgi:hypothetical protein
MTTSPDTILSAPCGAIVQGVEMPLVVNHRFNVLGSYAETVLLTADGRGKVDGWHTGPDGEDADWIYFERWGLVGRVAHGWLHAKSRQLLQAG